MEKQHYRAVWISDVHLGSRGCKAEELTTFLKSFRTDHLYLVGDIVDLWALQRRVYFPSTHVNVIRKILKHASKCRVTYIVGNHDEAIRSLIPMTFGSVFVANETIHVLADGRKLLVIHGDAFDQVMRYAKWAMMLGDIGYSLLLRSNSIVNWTRRKFGLGYWSLSAYVKHKVKTAANFIGGFEAAVVKGVRSHDAHGVVCGHIHHAEMREIDGFLYLNTGDWVESLTALVEHDDGRLELVRYADLFSVDEITPHAYK